MRVCVDERMTSINTQDENGRRRRVRERTLGLPATAERALMAKAYENYATAQDLHVRAHNAYRAACVAAGSRRGVDVSQERTVKKALTRATETALYLADAKAQYRRARTAAEAASRRAA